MAREKSNHDKKQSITKLNIFLNNNEEVKKIKIFLFYIVVVVVI